MFSHTQSLDSQAQKLNSQPTVAQPEPDTPVDSTIDNPVEPTPDDAPRPVEEVQPSISEPIAAPDPIAEAEQRGFMRAMAMKIDELFNRPSAGMPTFPKPDETEADASDIIVLSRIRRSVWDC